MLNDNQKRLYARHLVLEHLGPEGQEALLRSRVLIIGAGGLGSAASLYLAAAGVGTLGIADGDVVETANLQRQIIHRTSSEGRNKAESAAQALRELNPSLTINVYPRFLTRETIRELIRDYDFIVDAVDDMGAKLMINDACVLEGKPATHAGVIRWEAQLMTCIPRESPCYRCISGSDPAPGSVPSCREVGVIGAAVGVTGSLQALEAIKYLTGAGDLLTGHLLTFDALAMQFEKIRLPGRNPRCPVCGNLQNPAEPAR